MQAPIGPGRTFSGRDSTGSPRLGLTFTEWLSPQRERRVAKKGPIGANLAPAMKVATPRSALRDHPAPPRASRGLRRRHAFITLQPPCRWDALLGSKNAICGPGQEGNSAVWKPANSLSETRDPRTRTENSGVDGHEHVDCSPQERRWLESRVNEAATMRPHTFCVVCGKVKWLEGPRARARGFYLSGLSALKEHLERSAHYHKMTQSQTRLISKGLEHLEEFEDTYGLGLGPQVRLYLGAVQRVRPDLDDEVVVRLLPKLRTKKKPLFDVLRPPSAEVLQPGY